MSERTALLNGILREPACDTRRLVYADWLQEERGRGSDLGEFIRVQHAISLYDDAYYLSYTNRKMCENSAVPDVQRSADLLHGAWSAEIMSLNILATECNDWRFRRGFVYHIELPCAAFLQHAEAIFRQHPVTSVRLTDRTPYQYPVSGDWSWAFIASDDMSRASTSASLPNSFREGVLLHPLRYDPNGSQLPRSRGLTFSTREDAERVLSDVAVAYARRLAGLPPLSANSASSITAGSLPGLA